MKPKYFPTYLLIAFLLISNDLQAQWNSFVRSFSRNEYGLNGQTWNISPANQDFVFFANGNNVVQYSQGRMSKIPFKTDVRSVKVSFSHKCLFVGGIGEFGYFKPTTNGTMKYTSLSDSLDKENASRLGNIWSILENDEVNYFITDGMVIKYVGNRLQTIHSPAHINCSAIVGGLLYLAIDNGLYVLRDNELKPCKGSEAINNYLIRGIASYNDGILLTTQKNGIFYYNGISCEEFITDADNFIINNEVFCTDGGYKEMAIGTIKGGIALINKETRNARYITEANGLKNNTVISVAFGFDGCLWTGLDNGIDQVFVNGNLMNLYTYPNFYGTGYDAKVFENHLYLATNRGIFFTQWPLGSSQIPKISEVSGSGGQVWKLFEFQNMLLCLLDRGLFCISDGKLRQISEIQGFWGMVKLKGNKLLAGTYSSLYLLELTENKDFKITYIDNISGSFQNMVCIGDTVWLHSHNSTEITRAIFNSLNNTFTNIKKYNLENGIPDDRQIFISKVADRIYISSDNGIYKFDSQIEKFIKCQNLGNLNCDLPLDRLSEIDGKIVTLSKNNISFSIGNELKTYFFKTNFIENEPLINSPSALNDSIFIIPNVNGFAIVNINQKANESEKSQNLINQILISNVGDSIIYSANFLNIKNVPKIDYEFANIRFEYGENDKDIKYSYKLDENSQWSEPTNSPTKEFTQLHEGKYTFKVRKIICGQVAAEDSFEFLVLPPWYRTTWAKIIWILLSISALMITIQLVHRHVNHVRKQISEQKDEDIKQREIDHARQTEIKERKIMEMEKEKLETELKHKTNELAGMLINIAGKNEILNELKTDISSIIEDEKSNLMKQKLNSLNSKIDSNIQNDNIIKRFESQFDLLHNNFMQRLQVQHSELSKNERLLCAYIRMELNTKEIAQLLNISTRGVETMRYRLKKKLVTDKEIELNEYLKQFEK